MLHPEVFTRLRAAQLRSVKEQELLSGRNWILICAGTHLLGLIYPAFLWLHILLLNAQRPGQVLHPALTSLVIVFSACVLLLCWWWARYAPYRSAVLALVAFVMIHTTHALLDPTQLAVAAVVKAVVILGLLQAIFVAHGRRRPQ